MAEVKLFRVEGYIKKPREKIFFRKEYRALTEREVLEKVFSELGSKHRAKRAEIVINQLKEIEPEEASDPVIRQMLEVMGDLSGEDRE